MPAISYLLGYLLLEVKDGDHHDIDGGCVEDGHDDDHDDDDDDHHDDQDGQDGFSFLEIITS